MAYDELKTEAETGRQRLVHGLWSLAQVQSWADELITRIESPPAWLIDLSAATTIAEAGEALLRAEGEPDMTQVWAALMGDWSRLLEAQPDRDSEIAREL